MDHLHDAAEPASVPCILRNRWRLVLAFVPCSECICYRSHWPTFWMCFWRSTTAPTSVALPKALLMGHLHGAASPSSSATRRARSSRDMGPALSHQLSSRTLLPHWHRSLPGRTFHAGQAILDVVEGRWESHWFSKAPDSLMNSMVLTTSPSITSVIGKHA